MDSRTIQIIGLVILLAGVGFGSSGAHKIWTNLPLSEEKATAAARSVRLAEDGIAEGPAGRTLHGSVELHVLASAIEMANLHRKAKREEGLLLLVSGALAVMWGITVLYNSRHGPGTS
jgi:hypothetical protein